VQVNYLAWTDQGLMRQVIYQGIREDKPGNEVRRSG
jgi:bifunctional non-homologous end joining protein LigD